MWEACTDIAFFASPTEATATMLLSEAATDSAAKVPAAA